MLHSKISFPYFWQAPLSIYKKNGKSFNVSFTDTSHALRKLFAKLFNPILAQPFFKLLNFFLEKKPIILQSLKLLASVTNIFILIRKRTLNFKKFYWNLWPQEENHCFSADIVSTAHFSYSGSLLTANSVFSI